MGYRNYIGYISKKEHEKIKDLTKEELYKKFKEDPKDGYVGVSTVARNELYNFGKYCEFGDSRFFKPVFTNKDLQDNFTSEQDFYIVEKEFLKHIIEHYTEKIKSLYSELLKGVTDKNYKNIPQEKAEVFFRHIKDFEIEWNQLKPYDLDEGDEVTTSWKYEYSIFELVRLYKNFNWKKNVMIYYGY